MNSTSNKKSYKRKNQNLSEIACKSTKKMDSTPNKEALKRKRQLELTGRKIEASIKEELIIEKLYKEYENLLLEFEENELTPDEKTKYDDNLADYYVYMQKTTSKLNLIHKLKQHFFNFIVLLLIKKPKALLYQKILDQ